MKKNRTHWHSSLIATSFALLLSVALFVGIPSAIAQEPSTGDSAAGLKKKAGKSRWPDARKYVAQGYSVNGPLEVASVTPQSLSLHTGLKDMVFSLKDKSVTVKGATSVGDIQKGMLVYVCTKGDKVFVYVLPKKEERNDV
jgi:hypothetical protein